MVSYYHSLHMSLRTTATLGFTFGGKRAHQLCHFLIRRNCLFQGKRTKKAGIVGKYGTRYGASIRKVVKKIEIAQHSKVSGVRFILHFSTNDLLFSALQYSCPFCGKVSVKRHSVGIWKCGSCKKTLAGGGELF